MDAEEAGGEVWLQPVFCRDGGGACDEGGVGEEAV